MALLALLANLTLAILVIAGVVSGVVFAWIYLIEVTIVIIYYLGQASKNW